jgi:hypothetical protein
MAGLMELVDHVCATCLGRIARQLDNASVFVCTSCGATSNGSPAAICGCGIKLAGLHERRRVVCADSRGRLTVKTELATVTAGREAGFRCVRNPAPGPLSPAAIVIALGAPDTTGRPMSDAGAVSR